MTSRRATLIDVAKLAGVSRATAARALTAPKLLSPETLRAVTGAIDTLGYVSDGAARALASGRSNMVGAVVPTLENSVFAKAIHHLQIGLADGGLQLVVAAHEYNPSLEAQAVRALVSRGIDAIVLVGAERPAETWSLLRASRIPVILTYTFHRDFDSIGFDNAHAGALAARHLIDLGHERFGFISGPRRGNDRMSLRIEGAREALAEAGLDLPRALISEQEFSLSGGKLGAHQLMSLARPPTAIIGGNDLLAAGAVHELTERGFRVPEDVSVIGMENLDITAFTRPALPSVQLPTEDIGIGTARHVLAVLSGERAERRIEYPVSLVERHSTARYRAIGTGPSLFPVPREPRSSHPSDAM
jgi:LacI family transcriptional regulator